MIRRDETEKNYRDNPWAVEDTIIAREVDATMSDLCPVNVEYDAARGEFIAGSATSDRKPKRCNAFSTLRCDEMMPCANPAH